MVTKNEFVKKDLYFADANSKVNDNFEVEQMKSAIADQLVRAREVRGISQKQLAELAGLKQPAIARLEKMHCIPKIDTLIKVLLPLGYRIEIRPSTDE